MRSGIIAASGGGGVADFYVVPFNFTPFTYTTALLYHCYIYICISQCLFSPVPTVLIAAYPVARALNSDCVSGFVHLIIVFRVC